MDNNSEDWQKDLLNRLAFASINEQRRARRWRIFFQILTFLYLFTLLFLLLDFDDVLEKLHIKEESYTAVVEMKGIIAEGEDASAENIIADLRSAFEDDTIKGIIIDANSPGGSPVQAGMMYDEIMKLKEEYKDKPIYAVVSDLCASACYYIVSATDKIYADKASLVGSIGVRMDGFGFVDTIDKLGIERRLLTAGENKGLFDPFLPVDPAQQTHLQTMLDEIHQQFIDAVKTGRGERLIETPEIFSGLFWSGAKAVELGLIDELATVSYVAEEVIKEKSIIRYGPKENLWDILNASVKQQVESFGHSLLQQNTVQLR